MLTRLKVSGFKNLLDLDVQFSPFTCIAGPNGVGKSNLFDAIRFISLVADHPLMEAAGQVRDAGRRARDVRGLFLLGTLARLKAELAAVSTAFARIARSIVSASSSMTSHLCWPCPPSLNWTSTSAILCENTAG